MAGIEMVVTGTEMLLQSAQLQLLLPLRLPALRQMLPLEVPRPRHLAKP